MRTKRLLIFLAMLALVLAACGGNDSEKEQANGNNDNNSNNNEETENLNKEGFPLVDDEITLNFLAAGGSTGGDWNDVYLMKEYEEMTNINVEWEMVTQDGVAEKRNLALASGDYPDVFYGTYMPTTDLVKYGEQGVFIPLNDLIEEHAPNLKAVLDENPDVRKGLAMADGNIYSLPRIYDPDFISRRFGSKPWIRGDWLEELGIDNPETTDGFYEYLKAVKETDLIGDGSGDEIPLGGSAMTRIVDWIQGAFGVGNKGRLHTLADEDPETGEMRFFPTSDAYKDMIEYLHKLYDEDLIERSIFTIETDQYLARAGEGIYGATPFYNPTELFGKEAGENFISANALEGPNGHKMLTGLVPPLRELGHFSITSANEHPEATVKWMDYFYSEEGAKLFSWGIEGITFEETPDGPQYIDEITDNPDGLTETQALTNYLINPSGNHPIMVTKETYSGPETHPDDLDAAERLEPYIIKEAWPDLPYTLEENDQISTMGADIQKYVNEMRDKFIAGSEPLSKWDEYVETLEGMGIDEYMEIQKKALDRYNSN